MSLSQQTSETLGGIATKAAPPVSVSIATVAGMPVSEMVLWATLVYTVLLIGHKLFQIYKDVKGEHRE